MHIRLCCITDANTVTEIHITIANTDKTHKISSTKVRPVGFISVTETQTVTASIHKY